MLLILRITFTILCAICVAAVVPAAVWGGWEWLTPFVAFGSLFFLLMLFCKKAQEKREGKTVEPPTVEETEEANQEETTQE